MALQLAIESPSGHVSDYHRIVEVDADHQQSFARVGVGLYKDQAARTAGKEPVKVTRYVWSGEEFPFDLVAMAAAGTNHVAVAYDKLKTLPEFEGAVDC